MASYYPSSYPGNPYVQYQIHSVATSGGSPALATVKGYSIDRNGNQTQVTESDWINYSGIQHTPSTGLSGECGTVTYFASGSAPAALRTVQRKLHRLPFRRELAVN